MSQADVPVHTANVDLDVGETIGDVVLGGDLSANGSTVEALVLKIEAIGEFGGEREVVASAGHVCHGNALDESECGDGTRQLGGLSKSSSYRELGSRWRMGCKSYPKEGERP